MSSSSSSYHHFQTRPQHEQNGSISGILGQTPPLSEASTAWRTPVYRNSATPIYYASSAPPTPLVLDPSAPPTRTTTLETPARGGSVVQKLLEAATTTASSSRKQREAVALQENATQETAAAFARTAPRAGFLQKMGSNIPEFKRRFFVLKPTTHLYYFLSPGDTEPRGCLDLEDANVEELEHLPDGRFRFALTLDNRQVILEARSRDVGMEWIHSLKMERLSQAKTQLQEMNRQLTDSKQRVVDLEKELEEYRMMERDRDAALEDAANWRNQYDRLNEAVRVLTQHLRRPPTESEPVNVIGGAVERANDDEVDNDGASASTDSSRERQDLNQSLSSVSHRETSLLDAVAREDPQSIDDIEAPGSHFSALRNSCQQLRENVRLASVEASTSVDDLTAANKKVATLEKRMAKAEKHLCKLWEENCAVRQELKVTKQEKKVLVKEVKNSRSNSAAHPMIPKDSPAYLHEDLEESSFADSEGERLVEELEEHVMSSIRLHEQLLTSNREVKTALLSEALLAEHEERQSLNASPADSGAMERAANAHEHFSRYSSATTSISSTGGMDKVTAHEPLPTQIQSLFDHDSDSEESTSEEESISSVGAELGDEHDDNVRVPEHGPQSDFERNHPLLVLDKDDDSLSQPNLCASSNQLESSRSRITDNGRATARLACPLTDVIDSKEPETSTAKEDSKIYHVTFYSRKIGIQFQKVPPPTSSGLLTEAMKADLPVDVNEAGVKTASELKRIAEISKKAFTSHKGQNDKKMMECQVATPVDAVLVCGFHGFDDTANHTRPKLGARLVAFDGISVEIGKWTFESIRKSIQARNRPLTLSFRNDFLTTTQRTILTKAVAEVNAATSRPIRTIEYKNTSAITREHESIQSVPSGASSHDTDGRRSDIRGDHNDDDLSASVASSNRHSYSAPTSVASHGNFRSFSEAPSSSVISSAIAPLMANLMSGLEANPDKKTPGYLSQTGESVENLPDYQDFKASLL